MLVLEIVSSRIVDLADNEKKYVAYTLQVRQYSNAPDPDPVNVERRYTHFLDLYNGLKKEYAELLSTYTFPRKIVIGNFDPALITTRCTAFEHLLAMVANDSRLRDTPAAIAFFQDPELKEAQKLLKANMADQALSLLEVSFKLLNKVYTDRSSVVLIALCRIVACAQMSGGALAGPVQRWAQLALKRYEGVSDSNLLMLYIPLLHCCITIWETLGKDKSNLVDELNNLGKRGMKVESVPSLMEAIEKFDNAA